MGFLIAQADGANHQLALADGGTLAVTIATGTGALGPARLFGPNVESVLAAAFTPGVTPGKPLLAFDFTPQASGLMTCETTLEIGTGASPANNDVPEFQWFYVPGLTLITGGTPLAGATPAGAIQLTPTSTTPVDTGGQLILDVGQPTSVNAGQAVCLQTFAFKFLATKGQRSALVLRSR